MPGHCKTDANSLSIAYRIYSPHVKAPHDLAAHYVIDRLVRKGVDPADIGLFYITPCVAKIAAVKAPVGEEKSVISGVISPNVMYNKIMSVADDVPPFDKTKLWKELTKEGIQWSLTHGEAWWQNARTMAVDGIHNTIKFLERLENDEIKNIDFVELRSGLATGVVLPVYYWHKTVF